LLAVFELVLLMIAPRDLPVHHYALYAIQKVHFIITLISLGLQNERYNAVAMSSLHQKSLKSVSFFARVIQNMEGSVFLRRSVRM